MNADSRVQQAVLICPHCSAPLPKLPPAIRKCRACDGAVYLQANRFAPSRVVRSKDERDDLPAAEVEGRRTEDREAARAEVPGLVERYHKAQVRGDLDDLEHAAAEVADACRDAEDRPALILWLQAAHDHGLARLRELGEERVRIRAGAKLDCDECLDLDGAELPIAAARKRKLLPCRSCVARELRCTGRYAPTSAGSAVLGLSLGFELPEGEGVDEPPADPRLGYERALENLRALLDATALPTAQDLVRRKVLEGIDALLEAASRDTDAGRAAQAALREIRGRLG